MESNENRLVVYIAECLLRVDVLESVNLFFIQTKSQVVDSVVNKDLIYTSLVHKASFPLLPVPAHKQLPRNKAHQQRTRKQRLVQHDEEKRAHNSCSLQVPWAGAETGRG